jgi:hypothetical protein
MTRGRRPQLCPALDSDRRGCAWRAARLTWHFATPEVGGVPTLGVYTEKVKEGFLWS